MAVGLKVAQQAYSQGYGDGQHAAEAKKEIPSTYIKSKKGGSRYYWWSIGYQDGKTGRPCTPPEDDMAAERAAHPPYLETVEDQQRRYFRETHPELTNQ